MNVANELRDHLSTFNEHVQTLGMTKKKQKSRVYLFIYFGFLDEHNPNTQQTNEDGRLRSALITRDDRKYYLDLKENERGRFLRV